MSVFRIPYYIGLNYDRPGTFLLYYLRTTTPRCESIALTPEGYHFRYSFTFDCFFHLDLNHSTYSVNFVDCRGNIFKSPKHLIRWFKENHNKPAVVQQPSSLSHNPTSNTSGVEFSNIPPSQWDRSYSGWSSSYNTSGTMPPPPPPHWSQSQEHPLSSNFNEPRDSAHHQNER
jgi:hypothetical protein